MKKGMILSMSVMMVFFFAYQNNSFACTDFQVKTADGAVIIGRSMEFSMPLESRIVTYPRGKKFSSIAPGEKEGLAWTTKYGFLGVTTFGEEGINDGVNEEGLSFGLLWFPETRYNSVPEGGSKMAVEIKDLGEWILGNFSTVDEVKESIKKIYVWGAVYPKFGFIPPVHIALHDAKGDNIVIEFIDGETRVYDNPLGALTNSPSFDWHLANLRNYINLTSVSADAKMLGPVRVSPTGQGSGFLGLPGDWTPPSRFVRTVMCVQFADPVGDANAGVNLAEHILNVTDIPFGNIKEITGENIKEGYTQWAVIKDLTNKVFYFRTYEDLSLRGIDIRKVDLSEGSATTSIPLKGEDNGIIDVTNRLP